ncbi:MAG: hypothetical protein AAGA35_04455 [Patescibacteria group bacterium]
MTDVESARGDWFWKLVGLKNHMSNLKHKNNVLLIALIGSVVLNIALVALVLFLGFMLRQADSNVDCIGGTDFPVQVAVCE